MDIHSYATSYTRTCKYLLVGLRVVTSSTGFYSIWLRKWKLSPTVADSIFIVTLRVVTDLFSCAFDAYLLT